jgi:hypothetical protein
MSDLDERCCARAICIHQVDERRKFFSSSLRILHMKTSLTFAENRQR